MDFIVRAVHHRNIGLALWALVTTTRIRGRRTPKTELTRRAHKTTLATRSTWRQAAGLIWVLALDTVHCNGMYGETPCAPAATANAYAPAIALKTSAPMSG